MLDVAKIRAGFPALAGGSAYLDSAATAQKPAAVLDTMDRFYRERYAPVGRGAYAAAVTATEEYESARRTAASFIGASDPSEIVFTKNATEAINLVAYAWGRRNLSEGDAILVTAMEHHANLLPWQRVTEERGCELRSAELTDDGRLDRQDFERKLAGAKLVAMTHASNVLGTINPVAELTALAQEAGARVLVDGAQAAPQLPVDVRKLGADWYVFTGHKCYGPTGIGVLHTRTKRYGEMDPFLTGGGTVAEAGPDRAAYVEPPARFEAGTPPVAEAVGLAAALQYLDGLGMEDVRAHAESLGARTLDALDGIGGAALLGPSDPKDRIGLAAFTLDGVHPNDLAASLDHDGIAIRSGRHCAHPLHTALGLEASARISFGAYTTEEDIDRFRESVLAAKKTLV